MSRVSLAVLFVLVSSSIFSQSQEKVISALVLKLVRGTMWPNETSKKDFTIGVLSYSPLADELKASTANVKKGNKVIQVKEVFSAEEAQNCDALFIPSFKSKVVNTTFASIQKKPVMVFTNMMGMAKQGSTVNFLLQNGKLHVEVSHAALTRSGLKVSSEVKNLVEFID